MPSPVDALATFLERRLKREWIAIYISRGTRLDEGSQVDAIPMSAFDPQRTMTDFASELVDQARADAVAFQTPGPYCVWIGRCDADGHALEPSERFPMTFPECAKNETHEKMTMLAVQRELASDQAHANTEMGRLVVEAGRALGAKHEAEVLRAREDVVRERSFAVQMAQLAVTSVNSVVQYVQ